MIFNLVNGNYTSWGEWGDCSKTCEDDAIRMRTRNCTDPEPQYGGDDCQTTLKSGTTDVYLGNNETEACNQGIKCPG